MWSGPDGLELLLPSSTWESWDGPSAAWLPMLDLLLPGAGEPWDDWLPEPAISELSLESVKGSRKVMGTEATVGRSER